MFFNRLISLFYYMQGLSSQTFLNLIELLAVFTDADTVLTIYFQII